MNARPELRLLVTGRLADEVGAGLGGLGGDVRVRDTPDDGDVAWATAISGFVAPRADARHVRWFHSMGAGVESFVPAARAAGALLTRTVGSLPGSAARYVAAVVLADEMRLSEYAGQQRARNWQPLERRRRTRAAILGTGALGSAISTTLRSLGYETLGINRSGTATPAFDDLTGVAGAPEALVGCGVLVVALPLTSATTGLVDLAMLGAMTDSLLVNLGRGAVVEERSLRLALADGSVGRAVLDVHPVEPLPADHWCWSHPRVSVTPHIAALTDPGDVIASLASTLAALDRGRVPDNVVDLNLEY